ncbi:protease [Clostridium polyendosporum]|uniref:Protease n=1 Tax=Clostridium polyendosporum TaxID=69208 RepID=A0A919S147_9CLOT|nr:trypsin-like peptidase domain-containing protein [Clostridium polyendosporum]GIM30192.1 protease [Clostridium polyendosporum]
MENEDKVMRFSVKRNKREICSEEGVIRFKQNKTKSNLKSLTKVITLVLVASITGAIGGAYIVEKRYGINLKDNNRTIFQIVNNRSSFMNSSEGSFTTSIEGVAPSIVSISNKEENFKENRGINCSGVIMRPNGYIVTSSSAIANYEKIIVKLSQIGSKPIQAKLIGSDPISDIAVLKINASNLPSAKIAEANKVSEGDVVITVGNSTADDYVGFVTMGIVTSTNRKIQVGKGYSADKTTFKVIQTDALINRENTGGVLINSYGEVIGINSEELSKKYSSDGLSLVLEVHDLKNIMNSIISCGEVKRIALGFNGATLGKGAEGVYVQTITPNGSAAMAGMKPTDIIVEMDGKKIKNLDDIISIVGSHKVGDRITCKVLRTGTAQELTITLVENK